MPQPFGLGTYIALILRQGSKETSWKIGKYMPTEKSTTESVDSLDNATSGPSDPTPQLELPEDFMQATREAIVKIMIDDATLSYPEGPSKK